MRELNELSRHEIFGGIHCLPDCVVFSVHDEDIPKFAVPRLQMGIRWWEDVIVYNDNKHLYTDQFLEANPPTW